MVQYLESSDLYLVMTFWVIALVLVQITVVRFVKEICCARILHPITCKLVKRVVKNSFKFLSPLLPAEALVSKLVSRGSAALIKLSLLFSCFH